MLYFGVSLLIHRIGSLATICTHCIFAGDNGILHLRLSALFVHRLVKHIEFLLVAVLDILVQLNGLDDISAVVAPIEVLGRETCNVVLSLCGELLLSLGDQEVCFGGPYMLELGQVEPSLMVRGLVGGHRGRLEVVVSSVGLLGFFHFVGA
jgi:hypothetical protein